MEDDCLFVRLKKNGWPFPWKIRVRDSDRKASLPSFCSLELWM